MVCLFWVTVLLNYSVKCDVHYLVIKFKGALELLPCNHTLFASRQEKNILALKVSHMLIEYIDNEMISQAQRILYGVITERG